VYRLLRYDPLRNSTEVLLENLHFANGVQLSRYEDFVLVAETTRARIIKSVYAVLYIQLSTCYFGGQQHAMVIGSRIGNHPLAVDWHHDLE